MIKKMIELAALDFSWAIELFRPYRLKILILLHEWTASKFKRWENSLCNENTLISIIDIKRKFWLFVIL